MAEDLEFRVSLQDEMSGPAHAAEKSLGGLAGTMHRVSEAFGSLEKDFHKVVEPSEVVKGALEGVKAGFSEMASGIKSGEAKEVIAGVTESLAGLATMLDLVYPGLGQLASAAIKVAGAFTGMTVGLVQAGAELAIEATESKLAMVSMFDALGQGETSGAAAEEMLSRLSDKIGIVKDDLAPMAASFMAMGVTSEEALERMTLASASAFALMGKQGPQAAAQFETLERKIQTAAEAGNKLKLSEKGLSAIAKTGANVKDVAARMGISVETLQKQLKAGTANAKEFGDALEQSLIEKGQGPLNRLGSSLGSIKKMFSQSIDDLFEDNEKATEPFLAQIREIANVFSQSTESGKAMKGVLHEAFMGLFQVGTKILPMVQNGILRIILYTIRAATFIKAHWSTIKSMFLGVAVSFAVIGGIIGAVIAASFAPLVALAGAFVAVGAAMGWVYSKIVTLIPEMIKAGGELMSGLITGIKNFAGRVADAAKDTARAALNAVTGFFQVKSPSVVMMNVGHHIGGGLAKGIEATGPSVATSSSRTSAAAMGGFSSGFSSNDYTPKTADGAPMGAKGSTTIMVEGIHITAPQGVTDATKLTEVAAAALFERLALQEGVT